MQVSNVTSIKPTWPSVCFATLEENYNLLMFKSTKIKFCYIFNYDWDMNKPAEFIFG